MQHSYECVFAFQPPATFLAEDWGWLCANCWMDTLWVDLSSLCRGGASCRPPWEIRKTRTFAWLLMPHVDSGAVPLEFLSASRNHSFYVSAPESYGAWDIHQFLPFTFCLIMFLRSWAVIYLIAVKQFLTNLNAFSPCRLTNVQKGPPSSHFTVISYSLCIYSGFLLWNVLLFFLFIFLFFKFESLLTLHFFLPASSSENICCCSLSL